MPVLPTNAETLLTGLSDFWQRFFADRDVLNVLYAATEELLGQAYLDIVTEVLNQNLENTPIFNRKFWHLLTIREDEVGYDPDDADYPYTVVLRDNLREFKFALNRVYSPTVTFEDDVDFVLDDGVMKWKTSPFEQSDGVPTRTLTLEPTEYRRGTDGAVTSANPDTFTILGRRRRGADGLVSATDRFESATAKFTSADIGRVLVHTNAATFAGAEEERTITSVIDANTVIATPAASSTSAGPLTWEVRDVTHFSIVDVGREIEISDPADSDVTHTYTIASVSDLSVTFTGDVDASLQDVAQLAWRHISSEDVLQLAFWVPDAFFDRENLYYSFGYLVNRYQPSSESYRALISGIFRYFMLGPSLQRIESALNVMVGVPVVREDGEVVTQIGTAPDGSDRVVTTARFYDVPSGALKSSIDVGTVLDAFDPLTDIFEVKDSVTDPLWYHGVTIPNEILPGPDTPRRAVTPTLYPLVAGSDKWLAGDPFLYCGANEAGEVLERQSGGDIYHTGNTERLRFESTFFGPEDIGQSLVVDDVTYEITDVGTDPDPYVEVTDGTTDPIDFATEFGLVDQPGAVSTSNVLTLPGFAFDTARDVGRVVDVYSATTIPTGRYVIAGTLSPTSCILANVDGTTLALVADPTVRVRLGLIWAYNTRPVLRHSTGYVLMQNYLHVHTFAVTYDFSSYPDLRYPRPESDIRDVLDAGKPAHTYMFVGPRSTFTDRVRVADEMDMYGILDVGPDVMKEEDFMLQAGDGATCGSFYAYSGPQTAELGVVRPADFATEYEIPGAEDADEITVRACLTGGTAPSLEVTFYAWDGASWVLTGDVEDIDASTPSFTLSTGGLRMAITVVASGAPATAGVAWGVIHDPPTVVAHDAPTLSSETGVTTDATATFSDANFEFTTFDVLRDIYVEIDSVWQAYRIVALTDENTVEVVDAITGVAPTFAAGTGLSWWLGTPRATATSIVAGGVTSQVEKTDPANYIVPWPVGMLLEMEDPPIVLPSFALVSPTVITALNSEVVAAASYQTTSNLTTWDAASEAKVSDYDASGSRTSRAMRSIAIDRSDKVTVTATDGVATPQIRKLDADVDSFDWDTGADVESSLSVPEDGSSLVAGLNTPNRIAGLDPSTGAVVTGFAVTDPHRVGAFSGKERDYTLWSTGTGGTYNDLVCYDVGEFPDSATAAGTPPTPIFSINLSSATSGDFNVITTTNANTFLITGDRLESGGWWVGVMGAVGQYGGFGGAAKLYQAPFLFHVTRAGVVDVEIDLRAETAINMADDRDADIKDLAVDVLGRVYVILEPIYTRDYPPVEADLPHELQIRDTDGSFLWSSVEEEMPLPSVITSVAVTRQTRIAIVSGYHQVNPNADRTDEIYFMPPFDGAYQAITAVPSSSSFLSGTAPTVVVPIHVDVDVPSGDLELTGDAPETDTTPSALIPPDTIDYGWEADSGLNLTGEYVDSWDTAIGTATLTPDGLDSGDVTWTADYDSTGSPAVDLSGLAVTLDSFEDGVSIAGPVTVAVVGQILSEDHVSGAGSERASVIYIGLGVSQFGEVVKDGGQTTGSWALTVDTDAGSASVSVGLIATDPADSGDTYIMATLDSDTNGGQVLYNERTAEGTVTADADDDFDGAVFTDVQLNYYAAEVCVLRGIYICGGVLTGPERSALADYIEAKWPVT